MADGFSLVEVFYEIEAPAFGTDMNFGGVCAGRGCAHGFFPWFLRNVYAYAFRTRFGWVFRRVQARKARATRSVSNISVSTSI